VAKDSLKSFRLGATAGIAGMSYMSSLWARSSIQLLSGEPYFSLMYGPYGEWTRAVNAIKIGSPMFACVALIALWWNPLTDDDEDDSERT
jgi:hypothetical protein